MVDYSSHPRTWERDPIITPTGLRSEVASGKMAKWMRFNDPSTLVWVTAPDGRMVALTQTQISVYHKVRSLSGTATRVTMREIAAELHCAPSTVYRAAVKLASFGFVAYQSNRGRHGGSMFLLREAKDGLDWFQEDARAKIRRWWKASEERISRLRGNVASMFPGRERELYQYPYTVDVVGRNKYPAWTAEEIREALGE